MSPWFSLIISLFALGVSGITAWLTFFRKGKLKMTQPAALAFLPDTAENEGRSQVLLRTLFYSTAERGQILESLHVTIRRGESKQNFSVWVYGQKDDLRRGSGLFVPQDGVTFDHYFLLPKDGVAFAFLPGEYRLSVFAKLVRSRVATELMTLSVSVSDAESLALRKPNAKLFFDWGPDRQNYHSHVVTRT
jgi:hypothetical protein